MNKNSLVYPWYSPRIWHGMPISILLKLSVNLFKRSSYKRYGLLSSALLICSIQSILNYISSIVEKIKYQSYIEHEVVNPVFIIGYWRSGTTLLHELLTTHKDLVSPTTFQCFNPISFCSTEKIFYKIGNFLLPKQRPIDSRKLEWNSPQEDEFAQLTLGSITPYKRIAFPSQGSQLQGLDIETEPAELKAQWINNLLLFYKRILSKRSGRILIKNPCHTVRVRLLLTLFPTAKFIYITKTPFESIPSAVKLWKTLDILNSFECPIEFDYFSYSLKLFSILSNSFENIKSEIPANSLYTIRFEDLVSNPRKELESIFNFLQLESSKVSNASYQKIIDGINKLHISSYSLTAEEYSRIATESKSFCENYGYDIRE